MAALLASLLLLLLISPAAVTAFPLVELEASAQENHDPPPLCYLAEASPLDYIPLDIRSLPGDATSMTAAQVAAEAPYWDLSCPWEWSKFSCSHQGQTPKAIAAYVLSRRIDAGGCRLTPFDATRFLSLLGERKLVFVGDSLSRQMFVSLACLLHAAAPAVTLLEDGIEWNKTWPCLGLPNCVKGGRHSGFSHGCVKFAPAGAPAAVLEVCYEYKDDGEMLAHALRRHPSLRPRRDIVVANAGVHMDLRARAFDLTYLVRHAAAPGAASRLPITIYRETAPQHFEGTAGGVYYKGVSNFKHCKDRVEVGDEPRAEQEREAVAGRLPMLAVNPAASEAGRLHIGARVDCTHYCAPGVPDLWNVALYSYLLAHLRQLERGG